MTSTIEQRPARTADTLERTDEAPRLTASPVWRAVFGLMMSAVFGAALAARHLISDDPEITWGDIGWRVGIVAAIVTLVFALIPARWARRSWASPRRGQTAAQRIGIVLVVVVLVALAAMRSYRRMGY